ncbi:MAG: hypothetical protein ACRD44_11310, partial [Bryobacteraceae bacterium]
GVKRLVGSVVSGRPPELRDDATGGIIFAGGIELRGPLKISPEIRYTYRSSKHFQDALRSLLESNQHQFDFVLGVTF